MNIAVDSDELNTAKILSFHRKIKKYLEWDMFDVSIKTSHVILLICSYLYF